MQFNRIECRTQTSEDAIKQVKSGEVWGSVPKNGGMVPTVQAYVGKLAGRRGIEFDTAIAPEPGSSSPFEARWYLNITPGVLHRISDKGEDMACITATVENWQP